MDKLRVVGRPVPQINAPEKVKGLARYVGDLQLPRMLHGKVLRSPHAHARVLRIRTERAARVPGVAAVVTADDTPKIPWGVVKRDQQVLAVEKVRHVGEEVAAVAAQSEEAAREALERIEVDYEVLPAVFDPEEAMAPGAPEVHRGTGNIAREMHIHRGDVERGFAESAVIHEETYTTPHQFQTYLEPLGALADIDGQGNLTLYVPAQSIYFTRRLVAEALRLPSSKVRVVQTCVGGAFGGKLGEDPIPHIAAVLAQKAGRPVRLLNSRLDEFQGSRPRMPVKVCLKMGVRKDGTLAAKETRIIGNNGAYSCFSYEVIQVTATRMDSLYRQENLRTDAYLVYTNLIPAGAFRGFGNPQMAFPLESHLDVLAEKLGMDPAELRLRNVIRKGETSIHGWEMGSCGIEECIEKATSAVDWKRLRAAPKGGRVRTGVGLACAIHSTSNRQLSNWDGSTAVVKVADDGKAQVICGEGDLGQGSQTVVAQIAAEVLGLEVEDVRVSSADTDTTPLCFGGYGSRLTLMAGNAVQRAAGMCRDRLLRIAADEWEVSPGDLGLERGVIFVKSAPDKKMTLGEAVRANLLRPGGDVVYSQATWDAPTEMPDPETGYGKSTSACSFVCVAAVVEVDTETGQVRLQRMVAADDLGRAINPLTVEGQVHGELAQGLGFALFENAVLDSGQFANGNLADYTVPKAETLPDFTSIFVESIDPNGPFGAKGCSECALVPCGAVIGNAVYDAVGVRLTSLPIRPEAVLKALSAGRR
ncbi:MAG: xanthine dehydrogenase family protein molybdopterin-binding subunit [Candidatus Tectomicrobia bacterium]|nr:xanthine dehydrogenase family protein molybdopterin-binding subunit [Candidatus Tectomicrobia bacterium]